MSKGHRVIFVCDKCDNFETSDGPCACGGRFRRTPVVLFETARSVAERLREEAAQARRESLAEYHASGVWLDELADELDPLEMRR